jgi:CRP-like cAMP-binding protein
MPPDNLLLASLPAEARRRLAADSVLVKLPLQEILAEPGERVRHAYFPIDGFISLVTPAQGRRQLEIGLVGSEGMLGVSLMLDVDRSPVRALVQGAGHAWRVDAAILRRELDGNPAFCALLDRYLYVFLSQLVQTATCVGFHPIQARLARWLLMTRDRAHSNQFHITHEFLALMLGVRRVGVTRAASGLRRRQLIRYRRGDIAILDVRGLERTACGCYDIDKQTHARFMGRKAPVRRRADTVGIAL